MAGDLSGGARAEPHWESLVEAGRELWTAGLVTSHGGNLSLRRPGGGALISGTGTMLGRLTRDLLVAVNADGSAVDPVAPAPSSDTRIHVAIYNTLPGADAVIHAHPVHAIALAFDADAIEPRNLEGRLFLGRVPVIEAEWEQSAVPVAEALGTSPVVVVRGHGSYARGVDIWDALRVTSALEESAQILWLLRS